MKKTILTYFVALLCVVTITFEAWSQAGVTTPRTPSPGATITQTLGISTISVNYSRPSVKGRKVWGELVPFGWNTNGVNDAPWRAGANENTVLELSSDAMIEGKKVPAGKYGFFLVVNQDNTGEVVLSKDYRSWGHFRYNPANDQLRAPIKIRDHEFTELLTYDFINLTKNSAELVLNWDKKQFPVKIELDVDGIVMNNARQELMGQKGFTWQAYSSAANYAIANKVDNDQALAWADQAVNINRNFQTLQVKANALRAAGKTADADNITKEALTLGNENDINTYGYALLAQGQNDKAIEVLTLNTTRFPTSANAFDSLGEALVAKGDNKNAIKNFKKALTMNPPAAVKVNSEKFLKQLGAM
jgi:tetratricopeptide (TPR) repeat protein